MNVHAITHAGCPDGLTSLMLIQEAFGTTVTAHDGIHGEPPPHGLTGHVIIADFSYGPTELQTVCDTPEVESVLLLDHHQTAMDALEGFSHPKLRMVLDNNHSGAMLCWMEPTLMRNAEGTWAEYLPLVSYVEDADLWRFELPDSHAIRALIMCQQTTEEMLDMAELLWTTHHAAVSAGEAVLKFRTKTVNEIVACAAPQTLFGHTVPVVASPYTFGSEVAGELCKGKPFAAYYYDPADGERKWGLRSDDDGMDVAKLAETVGGGGHKHAAGFRTPIHNPQPSEGEDD